MFKFNEEEFNKVLASRNITRKELCKQIGIDYATMYRIINKHQGDFKLSNINQMIEILNMSFEEIQKVFIYGEEY